ncbi:hypothetical protein NLJ89_g7620 [Agrocybe chaxingu]|uniref:Uncharacterized protein n=1 Tax=Agrocybe chaxingu TaxID=84603 RepID=A0A9W8JU83_9AGAR|nr:hypothetical protein NLJ89_g7620 [Agrocybe chaxingu]
MKFSPQSHIDLDNLHITLTSLHEKTELLAHESLQAGNMSVDTANARILGAFSIDDELRIVNDQGETNLDVIPNTSSDLANPRPVILSTTTGTGSVSITYLRNQAYRKRTIQSTHIVQGKSCEGFFDYRQSTLVGLVSANTSELLKGGRTLSSQPANLQGEDARHTWTHFSVDVNALRPRAPVSLPRQENLYEGRATRLYGLGRVGATLVGNSGTRPLFRISFTARAFASSHNPPPSQRPPKPPESDARSTSPLSPPNAEPQAPLPESPNDAQHQQQQNARDPDHTTNYSPFFQRLAASLPHPHRPTREDFLNVANGFWARLRVRFKWFTVRGFRRFNADDISAFVTWFVMSQTLWILIGTTTFFSVIFATINSLRLQSYVARAISDYLTSETGITIIFETAIVPKWKDSRLSFKNVYVSRRPSDPSSSSTSTSPSTAQGHMAAVGYDVSNHPAYHHVGEDEDELEDRHFEDEDVNYTMFDLNIDSVDVTLSLKRWLDGKGLVESAVVRGVRGVVDRRNVFWDPDNPLDPALFRHTSQPGDFELESLQLEDVLVTVYQPGDFRPYTSSIFRADIRTFRKRWMFYDFLCAENVVGQFDNCLFSLHKPQSIGRTNEKDLQDGDWVRMVRM